jgi:hypothetical protein
MPVSQSKKNIPKRTRAAKPKGKAVAEPPAEKPGLPVQEDRSARPHPLLEELAKYLPDEHVAKKLSAFLKIERLNVQIRQTGTAEPQEPDAQTYSALLVARMDAFREFSDLMNRDFDAIRRGCPPGPDPADESEATKTT